MGEYSSGRMGRGSLVWHEPWTLRAVRRRVRTCRCVQIGHLRCSGGVEYWASVERGSLAMPVRRHWEGSEAWMARRGSTCVPPGPRYIEGQPPRPMPSLLPLLFILSPPTDPAILTSISPIHPTEASSPCNSHSHFPPASLPFPEWAGVR